MYDHNSVPSDSGSPILWRELQDRKTAKAIVISCFDSPGVNGGEFDRAQSQFARSSDSTSPSHPSFTPSMLSRRKYPPFTGVCSTPQLDGGLLIVLPDVDRGGVAGKPWALGPRQDVSTVRNCDSFWRRILGLICSGCGEAVGLKVAMGFGASLGTVCAASFACSNAWCGSGC